MYQIALKMLFGDTIKYLTLVVGLTFSVLLISQQGSIFWGLMSRFLTTIRVTQAAVWVMEPATEMVDAPNPMASTDLPRVLSIDGVDWAKPFRLGLMQIKTDAGVYRTAMLLGVDGDSLVGLPQMVESGRLLDINRPDSVILDNNELGKIGNPGVGDALEINDRQARVVAVVKTPPQFFGYPLIYTTYDQAQQYVPPQRKFLSFILVKPTEGLTPTQLARRIEALTGLKAATSDEFMKETLLWYIRNTGIPINFGITVALGVIIGAAVAAQTFYTFIVENQRYFGTLKALGATNRLLTKMVMTQSLTVGMIGYGIGLGLLSIFGSTVPTFSKLAFNTHPILYLICFVGVVGVCLVSSIISIRRITRIEPAIVFRG